MRNLGILFLSLFLCVGSYVHAEFQVPQLTAPVVDEIGLLPRSARQDLVQLLYDFNRRGKAQIQVLIVDSLQGESIEAVSIKITDKWKLGDKKRDNGVLFLIAMSDRAMRIEVGQGLEGAIPDVYAKRIISDMVIPLFKKKKFTEGVYAGVSEIMKLADKEFADENKLPAADESQGGIPTWLLIVILIVIILLGRFGGGRGFYLGGGGGGFGGLGGGSWGGGGGGGSWSGGGGGFSGGGASGNW